MVVQLHSFWSRVKPIPCLLQSVARQVTFPMSKVLTPCSTASMIHSLDLSNESCRSWVHRKSELGFSKLRKGSMVSDCDRATFTWLTSQKPAAAPSYVSRPWKVLDRSEELVRGPD